MLFEDLISTLTKKTQEILSPGAEVSSEKRQHCSKMCIFCCCTTRNPRYLPFINIQSAGGGNVSRGKLLHSLRNAFRSESVRSDTIDRSGRECLTRSKSLENIFHPDDIEKTVRVLIFVVNNALVLHVFF